MSEYTYEYDESLPNFDRNTLENILMCERKDKDDVRKLESLCKKMLDELGYRAEACRLYLETE